jgi:HSP20 family protein
MDFDKLMQWMDIAKKYQTSDFWNGVFDQSSFSQFMKENMDTDKGPGPFPEPQAEQKQTRGSSFPAIDIYLTEAEVLLVADLAGYRKENLQVSVSGAKLQLKGSLNPIVTGKPILQERSHGEFQRVVELPEPTDSTQIHAKFENGLLVLSYKRHYNQEERVNIE